MALPKNESRKIAVNGAAYEWAVSPDSGCMWLIVQRHGSPRQRLVARFDYHDTRDPDGRNLGQRRVVSPGVVRTVILHALAHGWRPAGRRLKPLRMDGEAIVPAPRR